MNLISEWKNKTGYTLHKMAYRLGISSGHCCNLVNGKEAISEKLIKRLEKVKEFEKEILKNPELKKDYLVFLNS